MVPLGLLLWRVLIKPLVDWFRGKPKAKDDKAPEGKAGEKTPPDTSDSVTSGEDDKAPEGKTGEKAPPDMSDTITSGEDDKQSLRLDFKETI